MPDQNTFEILIATAKLFSIKGNLHPAVVTHKAACLPTLSHPAYLYLPETGNKCYPEEFLFCFSLTMREAEHSFLYLKIICVSISANSLFTSFVHFSTWLLNLSLFIYRNSLYIREIGPLSETWNENIFPICKLPLYFAYGISAKYKVSFFLTSNLTLLFHGFWVVNQKILKPNQKILKPSLLQIYGKNNWITHIPPLFE